jgi:dTDP-4-dehydrorhamnose reductase
MAIILITGADGQLGNELKVVSRNFYGYDFIFTDVDTLDLTNPEQTTKFISKTGPDWIINCAAYNLVDKAEDESAKAMNINGISVKNITEAIKGSGCRLIHLSSDYIYDGTSNVPYNESSSPNPFSAYGRSKLEGEKYAMQHTGSMVIRTSWLYSTFGNNFVKTILRHAEKKELLNVVFDQTGTPTYAADLAATIMSIISGVIRNQIAFNAGTYNYSNEGVCTWYDFAQEIINEANLSCKVNPVLTKDYQITAAPRPSYSVMDKSKIKDTYNILIPHWRSSLSKCMKLFT